MMETKFKVWEINNDKMFPDSYPKEDNSINEEFEEDNLIYLQFTGLYDKESTEIYENDLLEVDYKGEIIQFRVYKVAGGFAIKSAGYWKDISDLKRGDELILDYLANPQNISWIKDNCTVIKNYHEK